MCHMYVVNDMPPPHAHAICVNNTGNPMSHKWLPIAQGGKHGCVMCDM